MDDTMSENTARLREQAADNLLRECAGIREGVETLFVNEDCIGVDRDVVAFLEARAAAFGARVRSIWPARAASPEAIPADVMQAIDAAPCTIFNHQLGPLLRLRPVGGTGIRVLNYATTWPVLESAFARVPYRLWMATMRELVPKLQSARRFEITCPAGTRLRGTIPAGNAGGGGFTLRTFPLDTHPPVPIASLEGVIALRWLVTSAMHDLGTEGMQTREAVLASVEDGRLAGFPGNAAESENITRFLAGIGDRFGKDPFRLNSWHAGVNPRTRVSFGPGESLEQWMQIGHSSPRILHFHVVGESIPGEISAAILDPTIKLDDTIVWEAGRLRVFDEPSYQAIAKQAPQDLHPFLNDSVLYL